MDIEGVGIGIALTGEGIRLSRPFEIPVIFTYIDTYMCMIRYGNRSTCACINLYADI
jgi:hypothetical protein